MKNISLLMSAAFALVACSTVSAVAADLPMEAPPAVVAVPSFSWTGAYVGVNAGYGWQRSANSKPDGWMLGGFVGANYQLGEGAGAIFGVETDLNYADVDSSRPARGGRLNQRSDYNGAVRGRLGFAFGRFLGYGAAGFAYQDRDVKRPFQGKDSKTVYGYTVGGGVEAAVADNAFLRAEYRYSDYGKNSFSGAKSDSTEHRVMGGVAFKFDSPF